MEMIGLDAFQGPGVLIKARMKTRAMSQWDVMRAYNLRLKRKFDAAGIHFPGVVAASAAPAAGAPAAPIAAPAAEAAPKPPHPAKAAEAEAKAAEGKSPASGSSPPISTRG